MDFKDAEPNVDFNMSNWNFTIVDDGIVSVIPIVPNGDDGDLLGTVTNVIPTDAESIGASCVIEDSKEDDLRDYHRVWNQNSDGVNHCPPDRRNKDHKIYDNNASCDVAVTEIDK